MIQPDTPQAPIMPIIKASEALRDAIQAANDAGYIVEMHPLSRIPDLAVLEPGTRIGAAYRPNTSDTFSPIIRLKRPKHA